MLRRALVFFMLGMAGFALPARAQTANSYAPIYSDGYNGWTPYSFGSSISNAPVPGKASPNFATDELGVRYWYSSADVSYKVSKPQISSLDYKVDDSESGEMFFYLTSPHSRYLFKGVVGFGGEQNGNVDDSDYNPDGSRGSDTNSIITGGRLFYGYADLGYKLNFLSGASSTTSLLGGAGYIQDVMTARGVSCKQAGSGSIYGPGGTSPSPCTSTGQTLIGTGIKSLQNEAEWTIFRVGLENYWKPTRVISWHNEIVAIPFANFRNNDYHYLRADLGDVPNIVDNGWGYGFQAETAMEIRLLPAWSLNFGGRYWRLWSDQTTTKFGNPVQGTEKSYNWDYERWGLFVGTGYHF